VNHYLNPEAMHPDVPGDGGLAALIADRNHRGTVRAAAPSIKQRPRTRLDPVYARSLVGLNSLPTIVAIGPFDDHAHAEQLAAAFIRVRRHCEVQFVLLGTGEHRTALMRRTSEQGVRSSVHAISDSYDYQWSDLVAAADLVVLGSSSGTAVLLDVLAAGRPVVAPADPAIVELVVPAIVGLVYRPGDVSGMAEALRRLVSTPVLRRGMGGRARQVARRHHLEKAMRAILRYPGVEVMADHQHVEVLVEGVDGTL
jgi:glycosyltransferase involved in cell wall biosynthesis